MSTSSARPYRVAWTLSNCDVQVSGDPSSVCNCSCIVVVVMALECSGTRTVPVCPAGTGIRSVNLPTESWLPAEGVATTRTWTSTGSRFCTDTGVVPDVPASRIFFPVMIDTFCSFAVRLSRTLVSACQPPAAPAPRQAAEVVAATAASTEVSTFGPGRYSKSLYSAALALTAATWSV